MQVSRDPFEWWYSVASIAKRLGKSPRTIKRAVLSGAFGALPGDVEFKGREICGEMHLPWSAVAVFLKLSPDCAPAESVSWQARTEGELRRQVEASAA